MLNNVKDFYKNTVIGITAGVVETITLQPMIYWKNALQQGLNFTLNPRICYRGVNASMINMATLTGIQIPLNDYISHNILTPNQKMLSSFYSGIITGFICAPMELIMIQQQKTGNNMYKTIKKIGKNNVMRGFITSCIREGLYTIGYLGIGPISSSYIQKKYNITKNISDFGGATIASIIASTASHPFDTVKTCMQGDIKRIKYTTMLETTKILIKENGIKRLFDGWNWRTSRMILSFFVLIQCKDRLSKWI